MSQSADQKQAAELPAPEAGMTLGEHIGELRTRLFKGVLAVAICFIAAWVLRDEAYEIFMGPFDEGVRMLSADWAAEIDARLEADPDLPRSKYFISDDPAETEFRREYSIEARPLMTAIGEGFMVKLKVSMYFAFFAGGPYLLWQLWAFIGAGLYKNERRVVLSFFPTSILLFFGGVLFGYFVLVPYGMYYLSSELNPDQGWVGLKLDTYFTFISSLCLALGAIFQLPIVLTALAKVGLVAPASFAHYRGHFVLGAFVLAAVLTPPDPITQTMMAGPMVVLYEIGIWSARLAVRKQQRAAQEPA